MSKQQIPEAVYKSMVLRDRLNMEAQFEGKSGRASKPHFWVTVPEADTKRGCIVLKNFRESEFDIAPHPTQQEFARQLQDHLQREHHHDGMWIVGWTHPPEFSQLIRIDGDNVWGRLIIIFLDEDADPQFTTESERLIADIIEDGIIYYGNMASASWDEWQSQYSAKNMKEDMGLKDDQQFKATLSSIHYSELK